MDLIVFCLLFLLSNFMQKSLQVGIYSKLTLLISLNTLHINLNYKLTHFFSYVSYKSIIALNLD